MATLASVSPAARSPWWERWHVSRYVQLGLAHALLLSYTLLAVGPVLLLVINAFKNRRAIFENPYAIALPGDPTFSMAGFETVLGNSNFPLYFRNSVIVVLAALLLILWFGSMAAFALSEYEFRGNTLLGLYLSIGIMIPIRLGSVSLIELMVNLGLINTLAALILVYTANGLPLAIFVLSSFMREVPRDLKDAARVDGASEYRIYALILPLIRPALGTIAVFNLIPVWNDLWFPLILASSEPVKTVTLGTQVFVGQFANDYNAMLASMTISMVPIIVLYIIFSRQLIRGLTSGAVK
ncbi:MAG: carbohydrate ABC transporter permease [Anaerolineae bacterium]|jgi:raffinose/stachyose/melibiose transport system permease protein|nr:carbohydrate ABC transporter permease [Anaerolineae bacterium]